MMVAPELGELGDHAGIALVTSSMKAGGQLHSRPTTNPIFLCMRSSRVEA
jgi:hypothetical protein